MQSHISGDLSRTRRARRWPSERGGVGGACPCGDVRARSLCQIVSACLKSEKMTGGVSQTDRTGEPDQNQQPCSTPCSPSPSWDSSPSPPPVTSRTAPGGANERCRRLPPDSACLVAPETGAAALAPASAAGRVSAACWAHQHQLTARRRTTCSPPARRGADHVDLKEDAAPLQDSAATRTAALWNLTALGRRKPPIWPKALRGAPPRSCCSVSSTWPAEDRTSTEPGSVEIPASRILTVWSYDTIKPQVMNSEPNQFALSVLILPHFK